MEKNKLVSTLTLVVLLLSITTMGLTLLDRIKGNKSEEKSA